MMTAIWAWKALLLAILVVFVEAAPIHNIIIGYRTVLKGQADIYNKAKTLVWTGSRVGTQIGEGAYLTPDPGGWEGFPGSWYCVVFAERNAFDKAQKAWVPQYDEECDNEVWFDEAEVIDDAVKKLGASNPAKTVRLSKLFGREGENKKQLVIPPKLMGSRLSKKGPLGITVQCFETLEELPTYVADIENWPNTFGTPQ